MPRTAWGKCEPSSSLPKLEPFFGPEPGWDVYRDAASVRVDLYCTLDPPLVWSVEACRVCGDGSSLPSIGVCMGCHRSKADPLIESATVGIESPKLDTPDERAEWDKLPDSVKYPDRRPAPPVKPRTKEPTP